MRDLLTKRIQLIRHFYNKHKIMPTYEEICELFGFSSKNAAFKVVGKLVEQGFIEKMEKGRLKPGPHLLGLPLFNSVQAGAPTAEEEMLMDHVDLNDYLVKKPEKTIMINVRGDSMIDAGIHEGDKVLVESGAPVKLGDIVVAIVDGNYTIKYLDQIDNGKPILQPGNPKYSPIVPRGELKIFGKVTAMVRKL